MSALHKDGDDLNPFIKGLVATLPPPESEWPVSERRKWLQASAAIFELLYTRADDDSCAEELRVSISALEREEAGQR